MLSSPAACPLQTFQQAARQCRVAMDAQPYLFKTFESEIAKLAHDFNNRTPRRFAMTPYQWGGQTVQGGIDSGYKARQVYALSFSYSGARQPAYVMALQYEVGGDASQAYHGVSVHYGGEFGAAVFRGALDDPAVLNKLCGGLDDFITMANENSRGAQAVSLEHALWDMAGEIDDLRDCRYKKPAPLMPLSGRGLKRLFDWR